MPQLSGEPGRRTSGRAPRVGRTGWYCVYISWCTPDCRGGQDKAARYPHEIPGVRLADKRDPLLYMARKSWLAQITLATCTTCCRWPSSPSSGHKQNVNPPASTGLQTLYASLLLYHGQDRRQASDPNARMGRSMHRNQGQGHQGVGDAGQIVEVVLCHSALFVSSQDWRSRLWPRF